VTRGDRRDPRGPADLVGPCVVCGAPGTRMLGGPVTIAHGGVTTASLRPYCDTHAPDAGARP
jgi:hypothetical protein